ncbi:MFS transporter [Nocardioides sp. CFH 31398]|uniref:MFS transporter n=1 Tax=Nocardioides sp. CFH 31398 TaxID=2919579 RepID=UPI001F05C4E2|nr:MFS transporter [Nocardioides sp. CFH 31398]MCH1866940.1 MFS transporter [Nocardioides sp. CFH 31398]
MTGAPSTALLLRATTAVSTFDRYVMPPMLVAIAADLGVPLSSVVLAVSAYFLAYGLCQPLWGFVSDRLGRVVTMRGTLLLAGVLTIASSASPDVLVLACLRGAAGGFFGAAYPSTLVYVGDTVPTRTRQRSITGLMVGVAVGTGLASASGGVLADHLTWRAAFVVTGTLALLLSWQLRRLPEPDGSERPGALASVAIVARTPTALAVLLFALLEGAVLLGALTLLPTAVEAGGASASVAGLVTGAYGVAVLVGSQLFGRLSATWSPVRLVALGGSAAVLASVLPTVSVAPAVGLLVAALLGLAWSSMHSTLQTWATQVVVTARATMVSFFAGALFVGNAAGAALVGPWADAGAFAGIYLGYAVVAAPLVVGIAVVRARWRERPAVGPPGPV